MRHSPSTIAFTILAALTTCSCDDLGVGRSTLLPALRGETEVTESALSFDRNEFHQAMSRLDAYYAAPEGLQRPDGLSLNGRPDFEGIAAWVFDVYLTSRAGGLSPNTAFNNIVAQIERSDEWRVKHPDASPTA